MNLLDKLFIAEKYFSNTKYNKVVEDAIKFHKESKLILCEKKLKELPTEKQLLEQLIEKLKGKSVYDSLKKIQHGQTEDKYITLKGFSSLLTHTVIECEKGNAEYKLLVPMILEKVNEICYSLK